MYENGGFQACYYDWVLPVAPRTWTWILRPALEKVRRVLDESDPARDGTGEHHHRDQHLPPRTETDPALVRERQREKEVIRGRLAALVQNCAGVSFGHRRIACGSQRYRGDPHSFDRLEQLLADQAYRLSFWHVAADEINYRRFFDINELAAIRVEEPAVFEAVHELTLRLISQGVVTGLRIDHADGLLDPRTLPADAAGAMRARAGGAHRSAHGAPDARE